MELKTEVTDTTLAPSDFTTSRLASYTIKKASRSDTARWGISPLKAAETLAHSGTTAKTHWTSLK